MEHRTIEIDGRFSIDAKVFLGAAVVGFSLMAILKLLSVPQVIVTSLLVAVVVGYSVAVVRIPRLKVRLDQAGDNAYYLGLVFTLLSMGWALYEIGQRLQVQVGGTVSVAETVIGDFGVALGTTLAGIICRIVLHQMRIDPTDIEAQTHLQLAQSAQNMVSTLKNVTDGFGAFIQELQQKQLDNAHQMTELHAQMRANFEKNFLQSTAHSVQRLDQTAGRIHQAIETFTTVANSLTEALKHAADRLHSVEAPPTKLSKQFSTLTTKVDEITDSFSGMSEKMEESVSKLSDIAGKIHTTVDQIAAFAPAFRSTLERQDAGTIKVFNQAKQELDGINKTVDSLNASVNILGNNAQRSTEAVKVTEQSAVEVLDRLAKVVSTVGDSISKSNNGING